jgi:hypothetical protein
MGIADNETNNTINNTTSNTTHSANSNTIRAISSDKINDTFSDTLSDSTSDALSDSTNDIINDILKTRIDHEIYPINDIAEVSEVSEISDESNMSDISAISTDEKSPVSMYYVPSNTNIIARNTATTIINQIIDDISDKLTTKDENVSNARELKKLKMNENHLTTLVNMERSDFVNVNICNICHNKTINNKYTNELIFLKCKHYFHEKCIFEKLCNDILNNKQIICPVCNNNLIKKDKWIDDMEWNIEIDKNGTKIYVVVVRHDKPNANYYIGPICTEHSCEMFFSDVFSFSFNKKKYNVIKIKESSVRHLKNVGTRFLCVYQNYTPFNTITPRYTGTGSIMLDLLTDDLYEINKETLIYKKIE